MSTETRSGTEQMQDIAGGAQSAAGEVAGEARAQVDQAAGQARGWLAKEVDRRSTDAGDQITTVAQDARSFSELLRNHEKQTPSKVFQQVASSGEKVGAYLSTSDAEKIRTDAESFGRRQPWIVGLTTIGLGFAAARVLRASDLQRAKRREEALRAVPVHPAYPTATSSPYAPPAPPVPPVPVDPLATPPANGGAFPSA